VRRHTLIVAGALCAAACGKSSVSPSAPTTTVLVVTTGPEFGSASSVPHLAATRFLAFGDSITWGEDGRNTLSDPLRFHPTVKVDYPYPQLLQIRLRTQYSAQLPTVFNAGCRGEAAGGNSQNSVFGAGAPDPLDLAHCGPFATDRFHLFVADHYDAVLLMEGANDLQGDGPDAAIAGLDTMIRDAKAHNIRVFLATIPPEQQNPDPSPIARNHPEADVLALNARIRSLAASEGVTLVDVYNAFPSPDAYDLYSLGLLSRDGLHPLESGYDVIAGTFMGAVQRALELAPAVPTARKS
jgi:lysophospholipase L1-like esterase